MVHALPSEIEVRQEVDGVLYRLPMRRVGALRLLGLFLMVFGGFFAGLPVSSLFAINFGNAGTVSIVGHAIHAGFILPFIVIGLGVFATGLAINFGHSEIRLTHEELRGIERLWLLRWSWRCRVDEVQRLNISGGLTVNGQRVVEGRASDLAALTARTGKSKPISLALGYPRDTLRPLAEDIASRMGRGSVEDHFGERFDDAKARLAAENDAATSNDSDGKPQPVVLSEIDDESLIAAQSAPPDTISEPPADSKMSLDRHGDGLTIHVHPLGVIKGSSGLLFFSLIWMGILTVITAAVVGSLAKGELAKHPSLIMPVLIVSLFWTIGICLFVYALSLGKRRAVLDVIGNPGEKRTTLVVTSAGLRNTRQDEWTVADLAAIRVGGSNMKSNNRELLELQIHPREGKKLSLFPGRDPAHLAWLAETLRAATGVQRTAEDMKHTTATYTDE